MRYGLADHCNAKAMNLARSLDLLEKIAWKQSHPGWTSLTHLIIQLTYKISL
jgi:hypothetical protein